MMSNAPVLRKDVSDAELAEVMKPQLDELMRGVVHKPRHNNRKAGKAPDATSNSAEEADKTPTEGDFSPSEVEREYLDSVFEWPFLTVTGRADQLGLSSYQANRIKRSLLDNGLVTQFSINLGRKTRGIIKLVELTERGYETLGKTPENVRPDNVSGEHWFWQRAIARHFISKNIKTQIEMPLGDVRADVGLTHKDRRVAIEVGMTAKNEVANVKGDLKAGFDEVVVAAKNARVLATIKKRLWPVLTEDERGKVKTMLLSDFSFVDQLIAESKGVPTEGAQST